MSSFHRDLAPVALLSALVAGPALAATTLEWRNPLPQGNALWGIDFESSTIGYAVGSRGSVVRTTDGGASWVEITDRQALDVQLQELEVVAPGVLVAVTRTGDILRSADGGESWSAIAHPGTQSLRELAHVDGVLTALGQLGEVLRSSDGGLTWSLVADPGGNELKGQYWFDAQHGMVVGSSLAAETTDGGATWTPIPDIVTDGFLQSLDAIDFTGDEGVVVGEFSTWRTHDGGASWQDISEFGNPIYQRRVFMLGPASWIVLTDTEGANILRTVDDGATFETIVMRTDVAGFLDAGRHPDGGFVAVTSSGDLYRGSADGLTWTNATLAPDDGERITIQVLADRPDGTVFAAGTGAFDADETRWLRSPDGGESWVAESQGPGLQSVYGIDFRDDDRGLACGYVPGGGIHVSRTLDGGASWTLHPMASTSGIGTDVAFLDPDVALVSIVRENNGTVERSGDGGVSWSFTGVGSERMECVVAASGDTAYAGGGGFSFSHIFRTTDAGVTWTQVGGSGLPGGLVHDMYWLDGRTGLCAVTAVPYGVYRTTDAGASWTLVQEGWIRELAGSGDAVVAGGYDIDDFHVSTDGGLTWEPARLPSTRGVEALLVRGDRVVAAGYGSSIMTGTLADVVSTPAADPGGSRGLTLGVRPMAAGAHIELGLEAASELELAIFDVRGRRLREILSDRLSAGTHVVIWDGRDARGREVGSGVVWVRARTARSVATRPFVQLR